jgi:hypothetical protein
VLELSSSAYGQALISVRDILSAIDCDIDLSVDRPVPECFSNVAEEAQLVVVKCDEQSLVYLSGCGVHKCVQRIACPVCLLLVRLDKDVAVDDVDLSYIQAMDRGGLKYPTYLSVMFAYRVYCVVQLLVSKTYERHFLHESHQRDIVAAIVKQSVCNDDYFMSEMEGVCELCSKSSDSVLRAMLPVFVNIFLNNYTKLCNDKFNAKGGKKRKLKTLTG